VGIFLYIGENNIEKTINLLYEKQGVYTMKNLIRKIFNTNKFFITEKDFLNCKDKIYQVVHKTFTKEVNPRLKVNSIVVLEEYKGEKINNKNKYRIYNQMDEDENNGENISLKYKKSYIFKNNILDFTLYPEDYINKDFFITKQERDCAEWSIFCEYNGRIDCHIEFSPNNINIEYSNKYNSNEFTTSKKEIEEEFPAFLDYYQIKNEIDFDIDNFVKKVNLISSIIDEKVNKVAEESQRIIKDYINN
jgi:hypothetical protein